MSPAAITTLSRFAMGKCDNSQKHYKFWENLGFLKMSQSALIHFTSLSWVGANVVKVLKTFVERLDPGDREDVSASDPAGGKKEEAIGIVVILEMIYDDALKDDKIRRQRK